MCGISGFVLRDGERADRGLLEGMAGEMSRRGPDAQGVFARERFGLAHRRLSIIDLSGAAAQPFFTEPSGPSGIGTVFNGEIYNFRELRAELEALGQRFRSRSDTEVVVRAFEAWGAASFARFNGIFAFALLDARDPRAPRLHLARDRFGAKPLYYSLDGGRLAFASEVRALMKLPWVSRELDRQSIFHFLKFSHFPGPETVLGSVRQLPPGCWLEYGGPELRTGRFRDPRALLDPARPGSAPEGGIDSRRSEADWIDELDATLDRVVRRQVVSDVPVGCFLSGGVDSSLLALALSSQVQGQEKIPTFTVAYGEKEFDEGGFARAVAEIAGTEHHELTVSAADCFGLIPALPDLLDQPLADPTALPSLLLARHARQRVTVALSGDGGDELFFGYPYQKALLRLEAILAAPAPLRRAVLPPLASAAGLVLPSRRSQVHKASGILQAANEAELFQYFIGTIGPMRMDRLARLMRDPVSIEPPRFASLCAELRGVSWEKKIQAVFARTFLPDTVLAKTDRTTMAFGLEGRVPFLDDEMVELASRMPFGLKLRKGIGKYALRRLLERKLGRAVAKAAGAAAGISEAADALKARELALRPKQGFSVPLREWLRGDLKHLLDDYLAPARLEKEGIFSAPEVDRLVREHASGKMNHFHLLWSLIVFQLWRERHLGP